MARPPKTINWELVEKRLEAGNSAVEIAFQHNIHLNTFYNKFKKHFGKNFADLRDNFVQCGRSNILFTQYMKALAGNTNMLTLLGREWCGQGKEEILKSPFEDILDLKHENMILKDEIAKLKEAYGNKSQTE